MTRATFNLRVLEWLASVILIGYSDVILILEVIRRKEDIESC